MAGDIIGLVTYSVVVLIFVIIGIVQFRSKRPVGFYSGEEPPKPEDLTDVTAWNKKHGAMWITYGIVAACSYVIGFFIRNSILCVIPMCGGIIVPLPIMILYHHSLIKKYVMSKR